MTVLVTGANGFVGAAVVRQLGPRAVAGTRSGTSREPAAAAVRLDVTDPRSVASALAATRPSAVVHTAVVRDVDGHALPSSVVATRSVTTLAAEAGVEQLVVFGSGAEYGEVPSPMRELGPTVPRSRHGRVKRDELEAVRVALGGASDTTLTVLRPFHVTGRGEPTGKLVPRALAALHGGPALPVVAGDPVRDLVHVDDVARAVVAALADPPADGVAVNLCSGRPTRVSEILSALGLAAGRPVPTAGEHPRTELDDEVRVGDCTRASSLWGWRAAPLEEVARRCLAEWPWGAS